MQEKFIGVASAPQPPEQLVYEQSSAPCQPIAESARWYDRLSKTRVGQGIAALTALSASGGASVMSAEPVNAEQSHVYTIEGTGGEGVILHEQPGLHGRNDKIRVMMDNEQFNALCFVYDTPIGENNNPVWLYGVDQTGARGYFTDAYSSSRWDWGYTLEQQGLPKCSDESGKSNSTNEENDTSGPDNTGEAQSVFYSPLSPPTGLREIKMVADINISDTQWVAGNCSTDRIFEGLPEKVDTIGTWSKSRLAVPYFLSRATEQQKNDLKKIIMLDPGAASDMEKEDLIDKIKGDRTCDWRYNVSQLLSDWLSISKDRELTIVTGMKTEMKEDLSDPDSHSSFEGLWQFYLSKLWNNKYGEQVKICDYNMMPHEEIMRKFASMITERQTSCQKIDNYRLTQWNP